MAGKPQGCLDLVWIEDEDVQLVRLARGDGGHSWWAEKPVSVNLASPLCLVMDVHRLVRS